jgi:hypothetical protein
MFDEVSQHVEHLRLHVAWHSTPPKLEPLDVELELVEPDHPDMMAALPGRCHRRFHASEPPVLQNSSTWPPSSEGPVRIVQTMMFTSLTAKKCTGELAELRIFAGCLKHEVRRIERLVLRTHVAAGQAALPARRIRSGVLRRRIQGGRSPRSTACVGSIEPSEVIGEVALLSYRGRRMATVTAETPMTLLVLTTKRDSPSCSRSHPRSRATSSGRRPTVVAV